MWLGKITMWIWYTDSTGAVICTLNKDKMT